MPSFYSGYGSANRGSPSPQISLFLTRGRKFLRRSLAETNGNHARRGRGSFSSRGDETQEERQNVASRSSRNFFFFL